MEYFGYLNSLEAQDKPDYDRLVALFAQELTAQDLEHEDLGIFDADLQLESDESNAISEIVHADDENRNIAAEENVNVSVSADENPIESENVDENVNHIDDGNEDECVDEIENEEENQEENQVEKD